MNLASDRCESDVLGSIITSEFANLAASLSVEVVTELQLAIEAMLRLLPNLSQTRDTSQTKSLYPEMPNSMACTSPGL